jgi:hypothetical protein
MRTTMKNESNAGSSQRAIRKSCALALGAALLFASAPHAEASCFYLNSEKSAIYCPKTNTSGDVWFYVMGGGNVPFVGGWVKMNHQIYNNYDYLDTYGWSVAIDRNTPHDLWVLKSGFYQKYKDLQAANALQTLTDTLTVCEGREDCIVIHQEDFVADMCRDWYANAWYYETYYSAPRISPPSYCSS